jgi:histidinol-phosphatase
MELNKVFDFAQTIAREAGQMAMDYFRQPQLLRTAYKEDRSPVTVADRAIEDFLRQHIQRAFPDHDILGEEQGALAGRQNSGQAADYLWILDPIDGTRSFAHGIPVFGVQVALIYRQQPIIGVIHLPALQEHVAAAEGLGCFWNGEKARVSTHAAVEHLLVHVHERDLARERAVALGPWLQQVEHERNWGDCYSFVLAATGRVELAMDPRMQIWDSAPLPVLMKEAGGVFFDWQGQDSIWTGSVVCTTPIWASKVRRLLAN